MKLRTSFFDRTAFRKDVTRFAPSWGLYSVGLLLVFTVLMAEDPGYYRASSLVNVIAFMSVINFCYGILNAQLLFGDLYNSRMCNALHALPLRRETWFGTHVTAGLAFSFVPNLVFTLLCAACMELGVAWSVPLWNLLAMELQYICFFGIGVLCVMLTGNRFAGGLVYGLVNFFSMLVYWLVDSLYEPLLTGIQVRQDPFLFASPVVKLAGEPSMVDIARERITDIFGNFDYWKVTGVILGEGWDWTALYAGVGVLALIVSLLLYRWRNLERAGDFMAFSAGEPVLLIVYTLTMGGLFHLMSEVFSGGIEKYVFLALGLAVGFFTGLMLLQRSTRVFRKKTVGAFFLFAAVFAGSLLLTWLDPLGLTRWVPEAEDVVSVNLSNRYVYNGYSEHQADYTDPADIQAMIDIHELALPETRKPFEEPGHIGNVSVSIEYTLRNGKVRSRFYEIPISSEPGQMLKPYFSSFEYVTGYREEEIPLMAKSIERVYTDTFHLSDEAYEEYMQNVDLEELLRCIAADCAAGNMAQHSGYHEQIMDLTDKIDWGTGIQLDMNYDMSIGLGYDSRYLYINVYEDCVHTMQWLKDNGLFDPELTDYLG